MYGAIEAGGTKFVCAAVNEDLKVVNKVTIDTIDPDYTITKTIEFFKENPVKSIGIGAFGPIEINPESENYGTILNTPKLKWRNYNIYKGLKENFDVPIKIDTDVNAAALGELKMGHGVGKHSVLYITIGTGVGAGFVIDGKTLHGLTHPEMGHILIRQLPEDDFAGNCPTHGNCLEGLVAGPSVQARYGVKGHELPHDHEIWDFLADYIGQALMTFNLILSPEVILIGGGVSQQEQLFPKIRQAFKKHMNGYMQHEVLDGDLVDYIKYPKNGQLAGLYGSLFLAIQALEEA